ncbi:MAG: GNAT family N-acetyltransferase [candidate division Zixibacteria bacterium]|nr:GNAT family N-acetyltransferase [candidate division Zixibacteria bacterium]
MTVSTVSERPKRTAKTTRSEPKIGPLSADDLLAAARLMYVTVDDARVHAGLPALEMKLKATPPLMQHIFDQEPELSWGAYDGDKLVGFATSHMRDRQWHVAYLFVDPAYQNKGLGTALLRTGLAEAEKREAYITSQCTFTYNPKAIALYTRLGMFPRKNLILMEGPPCKEMKCPPPPEGIVPRMIDSTALLTDLNAMDREIRGINRTVDHCYWLADDSHTGYVFAAGNSLVGYAYISKQGFIAPVLTTRDTYLPDIIAHCLNLLAKECDATPKLWLNGKNFTSLQLLLNHQFRIKEIALLMTNRMFCDMRRYLPSSLAVF